MKKLSVLVLITFSLQAFAQDAIPLKKGEYAPFSGVLFTNEKANELRLTDLKLQESQEVISLLTEKGKLQEQRLELRDKQIDALSKRVVDNGDSAFLTKLGMFILGALVTTGIAIGVNRATK